MKNDLKLTRAGIQMSWPVYILQCIIIIGPLYALAENIDMDELQKSMGLIIAPTLLALTAFVEKLNPTEK